jgi:hypothetical protein
MRSLFFLASRRSVDPRGGRLFDRREKVLTILPRSIYRSLLCCEQWNGFQTAAIRFAGEVCFSALQASGISLIICSTSDMFLW